MKIRLVVLSFFLFAISQAQITFEKTYFSQNSATIQWWHSKFSNTSTKYLVFNEISMQIKIFNQDHSVYKTINIPSQAGIYGIDWEVNNQWQFCSEFLFNTDSLFEYVITKRMSSSSSVNNFNVYNETGNIIFTEDSVFSGGSNSAFESPAGLKLALYRATPTFNTSVSIYSLGGTFLGLNKQAALQNEMNIYLNPASNYFKVEYTLPSNIDEAKMEIYSIDGRLIKTYTISNMFTDILIDTSQFASGSYMVKIIKGQNVISKKVIKL